MDNENIENDELEKERHAVNFNMVKVFFENKRPIHISIKRAGCFVYYNGFVTKISPEYFFMDDIKEGSKLVFFSELNKPVDEYIVKGKEK